MCHIPSQNAPVSDRQKSNYVPLPAWREQLSKLRQGTDPHSTRQGSMSLLFLTYACCIPPKRAEVGTIHIFAKEPSVLEVDAWPNYIIMDRCLMRVTKHKTSKHDAHSAGITEDLPEDFMQVLIESLQRWPRVHLFVDAKGQAYKNNGFSKWVRRTTARLFGDKAPGISLLRHSFCTDLDFNSLTCAERDELAPSLRPQLTMQDQYRFLSLV